MPGDFMPKTEHVGIKPHDAVVSAKPATPEQIRKHQEEQKRTKEQAIGPRNSNPIQ